MAFLSPGVCIMWRQHQAIPEAASAMRDQLKPDDSILVPSDVTLMTTSEWVRFRALHAIEKHGSSDADQPLCDRASC